MEILQNFVAFSEYMNFNHILLANFRCLKNPTFILLLQKLYFNARMRKMMNFVNKHGFVIAVLGGNVWNPAIFVLKVTMRHSTHIRTVSSYFLLLALLNWFKLVFGPYNWFLPRLTRQELDILNLRAYCPKYISVTSVVELCWRESTGASF